MAEHSCHWRRTSEEQQELGRQKQAELEACKAQLEANKAELEANKAELAAYAAKVNELEQQIARARKQIFGPRAEKVPTPENELKARDEPKPKRGGHTNPAKRKENAAAKAAVAQVVDVPHRVPEDERTCPHCGEEAIAIGEGDVSTELEWVAGHFQRRTHVVETLRCPCKQHYVRGPAPQRVQQGCQYGPGFIAHLVVSRCCDSTPIYRMEKAMQRLNIPLARSTMTGLVHLAGDILAPLWKAALAEVRIDPHVQADETTHKTQGRAQKAYVWTFVTATHTVYVYSPTRSGETPAQVLGGTTGTLTVDGYTGYNAVTDVNGRERTGCWSHARRKLFEALPSAPEARKGLNIILDLFAVERTAKNRGIVGRIEHLTLRRRRSTGVLSRLLVWMKDVMPLYEPSSAMGNALRYIQNQWRPLTVFCDDPLVPIHNNASESALRLIALSRKVCLFFGNDEAGRRFAMLYSIVVTCEKNDVDPAEYLTDVLIRIQDWPKDRVAELLPHRWKTRFSKRVVESPVDAN